MQQFTFKSAGPRASSGLRAIRLALALSFAGVSATAGAQTAAESSVPVAPARAEAALVSPAFVSAANAQGDLGTTSGAAASHRAGASIMLDQRAAGLTRRVSQDSTAPAPLMKRESTRTNTALMLVGAGAVILGAAVGGDAGTVLIIGGAGVGFYGLYRFLN